jgi:hypothetical protein
VVDEERQREAHMYADDHATETDAPALDWP